MSIDPQLLSHLSFTPEDLDANRAGTLTDSQVERLRHLQRLEFISSTVLAPVLILLPVAIVVALIYFLLRATYTNLDWLWLLLLVGIVVNVARFIPAQLRRWRAVADDIDAGKASTADGRARISIQKVRRAQAYTLRVGSAAFEVPETITAAFREGERYRVYYTPRALILLSAETV